MRGGEVGTIERALREPVARRRRGCVGGRSSTMKKPRA